MGQGIHGTCDIIYVYVIISSKLLSYSIFSVVKNEKKEKHIYVTFNIYEIKDKSKRVKLILLEIENVYSVSSLLTSPQIGGDNGTYGSSWIKG